MSGHAFRFFFDAGSGTCLWAANTAARDAFGYAVDHRRLALPEPLLAVLDGLIARHDTSIDWDDPGSPGPWTAQDRASFAADALAALARLRTELPAGWTVADGRDHP